MANTDIINSLKSEFNKPLKNGEKRRIVFWNDYEKEFEDTISEVNIDGVRIHKLTNTNSFATKYLIEEADTESNFLIYNTAKVEDDRENWLLDIVLYSEQFYADKTSLIMKELEIDINLRKVFNEYKDFFNAVERRRKISKFDFSIDTEEKLELSIMGALSNSKTIEFEEILKLVLMERRSRTVGID